MQSVNVWLVGDFDDPSFTPAVDWLCEQFSVQRFGSLSAAVDALRAPFSPIDCLVLCATRPGRVNPELVGDFCRLEPLTRIVQLLGSWCEGEARSGRPLPGVKRVYWHQWRSQLPLALGFNAATSATPHLPRTATESDWLEATILDRPHGRQKSIIAVVTHHAAAFDTLSDALQAGGFRSVWQRPSMPLEVTGAAAILYDGWPNVEHPEQSDGCRPHQVLLLDFPRPEDQQRAIASGFDAIVSRPFMLTELWAAIDSAILASSFTPRPPAAPSTIADCDRAAQD